MNSESEVDRKDGENEKLKLECEKLRLENERLRMENDRLRSEMTKPFWKRPGWITLAGTVFVAFLGVAGTIANTYLSSFLEARKKEKEGTREIVMIVRETSLEQLKAEQARLLKETKR
jgi:hypothetical protein